MGTSTTQISPIQSFTGNSAFLKAQLSAFVEYLHWALRTELKNDSYLNDLVIPVRFLAGERVTKRQKVFELGLFA